jgi:class 3 adenylate cyclase/tetratricopeptide (TPR) repeat protein
MDDMVTCPVCNRANAPGGKFCSECGSALARTCPLCGSAAAPTAKFCAECGTALTNASAPVTEAAARAAPAAERRLVTVLFADLVGFTPLSESRDAEDVRELLSRYFETARSVIERYGGTVEKFIGDAVMALWGAPIAQEDDAERAVRAALDLVSAVETLGAEAGSSDLRLRAGALTGEAAVTLGAEGQGMVAGDLVNTASRIQAAAEPGTVLVGEHTRRASEAAVAYEDAGSYELKGKAEAVHLWRALRVIANRGGEGRAAGLEAPFVGRERELRLVKDLFHATAEEGKAHLLSVVGVAGIGKSRLAWEFEKYLDGLVAEIWWHKGRCLAYGDAIAYWALAEMVRMRCRITEDEAADSALRKLRAVVEDFIPDAEERTFVEPRLQHLLGLADRTAPDREDLFSAWRLFFERMAERGPVLLLFEDLQWADTALVEFVDYLLEWSRGFPIFVITLARPEVTERSPSWGASTRSFTSVLLEPLSNEAVDALLQGLVPGLSEEIRSQIRDRADGIPLYAVETVRMLLDRGLLEREGDEYRPVGTIEALDVPESLQALIAARLDGLEPEERRLLGDASVLGKTFAPRGLAALSGLPEETIEPLLASLVRKEVLTLQSDPRSPERGQYGFLQALVQRVAYEMLSRHDRKAKHLAAAAYLDGQAGLDPDEIAEVIAAHYLDAYRADEDAGDAAEIKAQAVDWLRRAGERAAALAATDDAQRAFDSAAELADDSQERARLLERAGELAFTGNRLDAAEERQREAQRLHEQAGGTHAAARAAAALGLTIWQRGRIEEAIGMMERAFDVLASDELDADTARLAAELGRLHHFAGNRANALARIEIALDFAEALRIPDLLAGALNTKSLILFRRPHESQALLNEALRIALENDLAPEALRAYNNLIVFMEETDRPEQVRAAVEEALSLARRRGDRFWEMRLTTHLAWACRDGGDWDQALSVTETLPPDTLDVSVLASRCGAAWIELERGRPHEAKAWLEGIPEPGDEATADQQVLSVSVWATMLRAEADGRLEDALDVLQSEVPRAVDKVTLGLSGLLQSTATLASAIGNPARAEEIAAPAEGLPPSAHTRAVDSQLHRIRANAAAARGDGVGAAEAFGLALAAARNLGFSPNLAPILHDYARWLIEDGRPDDAAPLLAEARELFAQMGATVWLQRLDELEPAAAVA